MSEIKQKSLPEGRLFQTLELYLGWESNPHERYGSRDFKSRVSTSSTTQAS